MSSPHSELNPALYFPVSPEPLKMRPGLFRLGHDFGNGERDRHCLQRDQCAEHYAEEKRRVLALHPQRLLLQQDEAARNLMEQGYDWLLQHLRDELGIDAPIASELELRSRYLQLSLLLQEDFALLLRDPEQGERLVLLSVCFPSGWEPEKLLGANFARIHAPVPEFEEVAGKGRQLVRGMVERGPYVRFVWSVTADARLDHHPVEAPRDAWQRGCGGYLRVERQVTVPLAPAAGSLFLIRTYVYPFTALTPKQRTTLGAALRQMPPAIAEYKGLGASMDVIVGELS